MRYFDRLWMSIVSSNDQPYINKINTLEKSNTSLEAGIEAFKMMMEDNARIQEELLDEVSCLQKELKNQEEAEVLEIYWNTKRKHSENFRYKARPLPNGGANERVDVRNFFTETDSIVPKIFADNNDEKARLSLNWVIDHITYVGDNISFKTLEMWLYAWETMELRHGDCEDGAILMANIMLKSGVPYWRVRLNCSDVEGGGHAFVTYLKEKTDEWVVLDWCYWVDEKVLKLNKTWAEAEKYFTPMWFSFNKKYIFKDAILDRV